MSPAEKEKILSKYLVAEQRKLSPGEYALLLAFHACSEKEMKRTKNSEREYLPD